MIPQSGEGIDEGVISMFLLLFRQGKVMSASVDFLIVLFQTQVAGIVRYVYAFGHNDSRQCVVGSIVFYLYLRFDVGKESWPEFGSTDIN